MKSEEASQLRSGIELSERVAELLRIPPKFYSEMLGDAMLVILRLSELGVTVICGFPGGESRAMSDGNVLHVTLGPFYHEDQDTPYTYMRATDEPNLIPLTICQVVMEAEREIKELVDDFDE
jgi:hypothetical protein